MGEAQWLLAAPCLLLATLLLVCQFAAAGWLVALLPSQQQLLAGTSRGSQMTNAVPSSHHSAENIDKFCAMRERLAN